MDSTRSEVESYAVRFERLTQELRRLKKIQIGTAHRRTLVEDQETLKSVERERDYLLDILHKYSDLIPNVQSQIHSAISPLASDMPHIMPELGQDMHSPPISPPISPLLSSPSLPTPTNSLSVIPEQLKSIPQPRRYFIPTPQQMQPQSIPPQKRRTTVAAPIDIAGPSSAGPSNGIMSSFGRRKRHTPPMSEEFEESRPLKRVPYPEEERNTRRMPSDRVQRDEHRSSQHQLVFRPYVPPPTERSQSSRTAFSPPPLPPGPLPVRSVPLGPTRQYMQPGMRTLRASGSLGLIQDFPASMPTNPPPGVKEYSVPNFGDRTPSFPMQPSHHYPLASMPPTYTGPESPIHARHSYAGPYDGSLLSDEAHRPSSPEYVYPEPGRNL
ncbi:hypothetical protein CALCODRAFT_507769 [Calocera cornea HHB12733]|uniref:Uncharacterized protein n=1 Tax=Calocera cornea HHB12733 TaxID=1353952 RepID=A0A165HBW7_9BASI|nr:hypothetical protein CALCODRAFT_507769 [Calocera cornea HHB12733]